MHPDDRIDSRTDNPRPDARATSRKPDSTGKRGERGSERGLEKGFQKGPDGDRPREEERRVGGGFDFGASHGAHSHRLAQVNSLIARVLRDRLSRGINDPRVQGMVSVLAVECTPDLHIAHVRISVLPGDRARLTLSGLRSATRHLEGVVRTETRLRKVPRLLFELDDSIKREAALSESLNRAQGTLPGDPGDPGGPGGPDDLGHAGSPVDPGAADPASGATGSGGHDPPNSLD